MILNLKRLFFVPNDKLDFSYDLNLDDFELHGERLFRSPIKIAGTVENRSSVVTLTYSAEFVLSYECGRCLKETQKSDKNNYTHILVDELCNEDSDSLYVTENYTVNMDELVVDDIVPDLPLKFLCFEDCKGLCPKCGANLNDGDCGCARGQIDSRLEVLTKLLNN